MQEELDAAMATLPNPPHPDAADQDDGPARGGRGGAWWPRPSGAPGRPRRPGGRRARGRIALRLPQGAAGAARAGTGAVGAGGGGRPRLRAGDPARAGARGGPVRHRASCPTPSSRSTACPTTTSTWRAPARCRWPPCTPAEMLAPGDLPVRYAGFSPCFRREAGAAGRDTRGIFRVHQFDKVEMFSFVDAAESAAEHERILAIEEEIMQALELPYRVVNIAVDDLGNSAAKKYDLEVWLPGPGALPRAHLVLQHHRLPGAAPGHPLPPR
ncbi:MAG: aminoacyl--tRNA ligase-related protein [Thermoleophilaceae bacterium]